jgi:hypothetical protein
MDTAVPVLFVIFVVLVIHYLGVRARNPEGEGGLGEGGILFPLLWGGLLPGAILLWFLYG